MARVTQISVSLDETMRLPEGIEPNKVRMSVRLSADCEPGPLIEQIARLQAIVRKVLANERSQLIAGLPPPVRPYTAEELAARQAYEEFRGKQERKHARTTEIQSAGEDRADD